MHARLGQQATDVTASQLTELLTELSTWALWWQHVSPYFAMLRHNEFSWIFMNHVYYVYHVSGWSGWSGCRTDAPERFESWIVKERKPASPRTSCTRTDLSTFCLLRGFQNSRNWGAWDACCIPSLSAHDSYMSPSIAHLDERVLRKLRILERKLKDAERFTDFLRQKKNRKKQ
jgi:hypothetical protein